MSKNIITFLFSTLTYDEYKNFKEAITEFDRETVTFKGMKEDIKIYYAEYSKVGKGVFLAIGIVMYYFIKYKIKKFEKKYPEYLL